MTPEYRDALNKAAAELVGRPIETIAENLKRWKPVPDYATDHNALPDLLTAVERFGEPTVRIFVRCLHRYNERPSLLTEFRLLRLPAAEIVRAALLACNYWTPELDAMDRKVEQNDI